ncbi:hypothetical protein KFU94_67710 [Chloroflexi bacterium TSY]|nr:hypothetical protein [Chloroflexi bacterium TSY]
MIIPNAENAVVDIRKLRDYALNPAHRVGSHKARLFAAALGIDQDDAEEFRSRLLEIVRMHDAELGELDENGQRYRIDVMLTWQGKRALILTAWIIRSDEDFPRLVTCYPI